MKGQSKNILIAVVALLGLTALSYAMPRTDNSQEISEITSVNKATVTKHSQMDVLADRDNDGLSDALQKRMAKMKSTELVDVIVTFEGPPTNNQSHGVAAEQAVGPFTLQREFGIIHGFKATMTVGQAQALARTPGVYRVQEDAKVTTQLAGATSDFAAVKARTDFGVDGNGVGICVVDTGIDPNHEQFVGRNIVFYDAIKGLLAPYDDHGHGTHVSAIAMGGGGTGANLNIVGVAPQASIFAAKVLDSFGSGSESQVIGGIEFCAMQSDVHILSMSLGSGGASDGKDAMSIAVNCVSDPNYEPTCKDLPGSSPKIVVIAAGNSGPTPETIGSPGAAEKAITVGAVTNWSENGRGVYLAAFSGRGPTLDGRIKPDISAPGVRILSAQSGSSTDYTSWSGTSMATPFVSGTVALMLQGNLNALMGATIPADAVRDLLIASAQDRGVLDLNNNPIKPDNEYGAGLLDVNRAVAMANGSDVNSTAFPAYHRETGSINNSGRSKLLGPFTITEADIIAGIPLAATLTIEGVPICQFGDPFLCDFIGGWEWDPDLDIYLTNSSGRVSGWANDITASECALSGEYCGVSRQETIHYLPPPEFAVSAAGEYWIEVVSFSGSGDFLLEVSQGPIGDGSSIPTNKNPVASFSETCSGLTCDFFDESADSDGTIVSWAWDFEVGYQSTIPLPTHTFSAAGDYTVSLLVTDDLGATDITSHVVSVTASGGPPIAVAGGPYEAPILKGKTVAVTLDGSASTDDGSIVSWVWLEGNQQIGAGKTVSVNFKEGQHTVVLVVTDNDGLTDTDSATVIISPKGSDGGSGSGGGPDCTANPNHPKC